MNVKSKIKEEPGFQYVIDNLELMSAVGQRRLLEQRWLTLSEEVEEELQHVADAIALLQDESKTSAVTLIRHKLMELHDIAGTLRNLRGGVTLNEVELFEIKHLALLYGSSAQAAANIGCLTLDCPLDDVVALLDPDHTGMANFYIYDSYDARLAPLRRRLKELQMHHEPDEEAMTAVADLFAQQDVIQQEVMERLSQQLRPSADRLAKALEQMAYADFLLAKATQAVAWGLCRPQVVPPSEADSMQGLFNPRLRHHNEAQQLRYQPVDIEVRTGVCLVTGANMAGKTVLLKTVGIAQMMLQFGMYVPAAKASMSLVDDVAFCIGDEQNEMNGLSSFASEIIKISNTLQRARTERMLVLIDEPARTTNPVEGKAIVQSISRILDQLPSITLITTHYSQLGLGCRRLRVRGFVEDMADGMLTPQNINRFMDYSLVADDSDEVPQEALRIASILGCDEEMIKQALTFMG